MTPPMMYMTGIVVPSVEIRVRTSRLDVLAELNQAECERQKDERDTDVDDIHGISPADAERRLTF
jgi:hypothetical protein